MSQTKDSRLLLSPYTAISASAGSGKTYNLVLLILARCLGAANRDSIRTILAITFTNKAAAEMKQRILDRLNELCDQEKYLSSSYMSQLLELLRPQEPSLTEEKIHQRAIEMREYILHHYSALSVSTIDKFNSGLIQSFTYELGLPGKYDLQIDSKPFLQQAVDRLLSQIGQDRDLTRTLQQYIRSQLSTGATIDLRKTLQEKAVQLLEDRHYREMKQNEAFSTHQYRDIEAQLNREIRDLAQQIATIVTQVLDAMDTAGIPTDAFFGGQKGIGSFFKKLHPFTSKSRITSGLKDSEEKELKFQTDTATKVVGKYAQREEEILSFVEREELLERRQTLIQLYIQMRKAQLLLGAILPMGVHSDIHHLLLSIEKEQDLVFLSRFNTLIQENLSAEHPSFLYEKVGIRYQHYFLDEFQDTSRLQWANLIPLRDDVLSQGNSSFTLVGDAKQSIYRFRGGDSDLMGEILSGQEDSPEPVRLTRLPANYRSGRAIVDFNNQVYTQIPYLRPAHQAIFGPGAHQEAAGSFEGYVQARWLATKKVDEEWYDALRDDIQACLEAGYRLADLCILHIRWKTLVNISQALAERKVIYQGQEISIPVISDKGLALKNSQVLETCIAWLACLAFPKEKIYRIQFLENLKMLKRIDFEDFTLTAQEVLKIEDLSDFVHWLKTMHQLDLSPGPLDGLSLYNQVLHILRTLDTLGEQQDYLLYFLEKVHEYTQGPEPSVQGLVQTWKEEMGDASIQLSESVDAIRVMTVHSSKGLEFPVVFLPFPSVDNKAEFGWWDVSDRELPDLAQVYTSVSSKEAILAYDPELRALYQDAQYARMTDRLCERYVATTRAVEQMYLYLPEDSRKKPATSELNADQYLFQYLHEQSGGEELFQKGIMRKENAHPIQNKGYEGIQLRLRPEKALQTGNKIKVATPSRSLEQRNDQIRRGIQMHEMLSKITTSSEVDRVLEGYLLRGQITRQERKTLEERIKKVMSNPDFQRFFDPKIGRTLSERDYLSSVSEQGPSKDYRPDRMIETPEGLILLDFKTGKHHAKHDQQIQRYAQDLERLGHRIAETKLVYID